MITEEIKKIIEENPVALATVNEEGNPHCIAVGDVKVVSEDKIIIGDNYMVKTKENILRNPNVSLVSTDSDIGYELIGNAEYFTEGKWLEDVKKIHEGCPAKAAVLVTVSKIIKLLG